MILTGLTLPAVQQTRESARRLACTNNCRQLALAMLSFESAWRYFPATTFNAPPDTSGYTSDRGLWISLLPFFEETNKANLFRSNEYTYIAAHQNGLLSIPSVLKCPSTPYSALLTGLAERFSGPAVPGLLVPTCDYSGNGGVLTMDIASGASSKRGVIGIRIPGVTKSVRVAEIRDGLSNTFAGWESRGDTLVVPGSDSGAEFQLAAPGSIRLRSGNVEYESIGQPSSLSWFYAWGGLRTGSIWAFDKNGNVGDPVIGGQFSRTINVSNITGQPFSAHPTGCNFWMADGSVRFLSDQSDAASVMAAASASGGEVGVLE